MEASNPTVRSSVRLDERLIAVRGIGVPVLQAGPLDAREAAVFVHGNPGSGQDWSDLVRHTGEFARAVAPDMPGFGRAGKPRDFPYAVEGYAGFLDEVLGELEIERAHLVLHDFGGPWGLEWAARSPVRVASVVGVNTGVWIRYRWHVLARIWRTPVLGELFQATATRPLFRLLTNMGQRRKLSRAFLDHMYDVNFTRPTRRAVLKLYRATPRPAEMGGRQAAALRPHDIPALVVWGARDPYLGVELAQAQREAFPRARVVVLDDSGHWPFADDPQRTAGAIVPFLREQVTPSLTKGAPR
ncbi:MAG: alpha/beta fold hydrolase [Solirubrobacterales bacterium]